jgi:hypothetical protein
MMANQTVMPFFAELTSAEDEILDELEDGLKKKKVRTEWKARVLGGGN